MDNPKLLRALAKDLEDEKDAVKTLHAAADEIEILRSYMRQHGEFCAQEQKETRTMETPEKDLVKYLRQTAHIFGRHDDAADTIERLVRERDEALDRAQELEEEREETVKSFESECWNALRSLLDECYFDWRDAEYDGVTAEEAREHISTTLSEMNDGETRQHKRAIDAEADRKRLRKRAAELENALAPFADVPERGRYGGPLVSAAVFYEDETEERAGEYAQISKTAFRTARAVRGGDDDDR